MRADATFPSESYARAGSATPQIIATMAWAAAITVLPVLFHLAGQWAGIAICVLLTLILSCCATAALPGALVFCWVFQSLVVSIVSPYFGDGDLTTIRAYSFLSTAVAWLVVVLAYWMQRDSHAAEFRTVMRVTTATLVAIGVYTAIGMVANPSSAIIYLRNLATPFLLFQIFALVAIRQEISLIRSLLIAGLIAVAYGYAELLAHDALFALVNGDHFMSLRVRQDYEAGAWLKELNETGRVMRSYLDTLLIDAFNTPLLSDLRIQIYRLVGPNFHAISFAYALAFFALVAASVRRRWLAVLAFPLLLVIGSKGAMILTVFPLLLLGLRRVASLSTVLRACIAGLAVYAVAGIAIGIATSDYHVIGFLGGLNGFIKNPLGHGIGVGGNLSMNMAATIDWSRSQALGQTDVAVESAIGVLLYQMGVAAALVFAAMILIAYRLIGIAAVTRCNLTLVCALSVLTICVNGIFQEEALFAPLALGLLLGLAGYLLGRAYRRQAEMGLPSRAKREVWAGS